jgi:nitrate reductase gamma subunit
MVRFWFLGTVQGEGSSLHRKISLSADAVWQALFSRQLLSILKVTVLDVVLQRRILKESVGRWSMHSLIFLPILVRFGLSLFTVFIFAVSPDGDLALALIDKNSPWTAFVYDLTGFCILLGVIWAMARRFVIKPAHVATEIEDNVTLGIVGSLVVLGFVATAARLLLTGVPEDTAVYSFVGYPLSRALAVLPLDWRTAYPYLWYAHAVVGTAFVAYLPFGKLKHIFNVPLTYYLEEISGVKKEQRV